MTPMQALANVAVQRPEATVPELAMRPIVWTRGQALPDEGERLVEQAHERDAGGLADLGRPVMGRDAGHDDEPGAALFEPPDAGAKAGERARPGAEDGVGPGRDGGIAPDERRDMLLIDRRFRLGDHSLEKERRRLRPHPA